MALKIPQLLIQYLYQNRKMALPGIGIFTLDKSVVLPEENDRILLSLPNAVQFQNANIAAADKELITYICEKTGKIRPLAIADLDSHLNLGMEMLNIGKPFHLDGIGTISKNKAGKFDFMPGEYSLISENSVNKQKAKRKVITADQLKVNIPSSIQSRNMLKIIVLFAALAIVGWGGYVMYKKNGLNAMEKNTETNPPIQVPPVAQYDSSAVIKKDSEKLQKPEVSHPVTSNKDSVNYKFVILATTNKGHALRRYHQLISFDLKAHLYQKDSTWFKVYFRFPALSKDTATIKDSLRRQYAHDVSIEQ